MARPKSTNPTKQKLSLTVSAETRKELELISKATGQSISVMLAEWAHKESKRLAKTAKQDTASTDQIKLNIE